MAECEVVDAIPGRNGNDIYEDASESSEENASDSDSGDSMLERISDRRNVSQRLANGDRRRGGSDGNRRRAGRGAGRGADRAAGGAAGRGAGRAADRAAGAGRGDGPRA